MAKFFARELSSSTSSIAVSLVNALPRPAGPWAAG